MDLDKATTEALHFLFSSYQQDSNQGYDLTLIARKHAMNPTQLSQLLKELDFIKDDILTLENEVRCAISVKGMMAVDAIFVERRIDDVLKSMGDAGTLGNIMEILKLPAPGFQQAFDLANEMQNRDMVKLLYAFFPGKVMIEMTLEGVRRKK